MEDFFNMIFGLIAVAILIVIGIAAVVFGGLGYILAQVFA
jgi:hypothetical protein